MNDIIQIFFTSILGLGFIIGMIFTLKNNYKLKKHLINEKIFFEINEIEITDTESLKKAYWIGNMKIYENYILIEKSLFPKSYYHFIMKKSTKKQANTINLFECIIIEKNEIQLKGLKHRVFGSSSIKIKMKTENEAVLKKINELINLHFIEVDKKNEFNKIIEN